MSYSGTTNETVGSSIIHMLFAIFVIFQTLLQKNPHSHSRSLLHHHQWSLGTGLKNRANPHPPQETNFEAGFNIFTTYI